jgi:hypothetical protein
MGHIGLAGVSGQRDRGAAPDGAALTLPCSPWSESPARTISIAPDLGAAPKAGADQPPGPNGGSPPKKHSAEGGNEAVRPSSAARPRSEPMHALSNARDVSVSPRARLTEQAAFRLERTLLLSRAPRPTLSNWPTGLTSLVPPAPSEHIDDAARIKRAATITPDRWIARCSCASRCSAKRARLIIIRYRCASSRAGRVQILSGVEGIG